MGVRRGLVGLFMLLILAALTACSRYGAAPSNLPYLDLSPTQFRDLMKEPGVTAVNVHVPHEGAIAGTALEIPYDRIEQELARLPGKDARLALYCRSGRMSDIAARKLASLGYVHIYNLKGGMEAWEQAGLPLEK